MSPPRRNSNRWVFTVNNFTAEDEEVLKTVPLKYMVYGKEKGTSGTPHLQGVMTFSKSQTLTAMKKIHPTAHWEMAVATSEVAIAYCKKGDQSHEEWTELKQEGPNYGLNADITEVGESPLREYENQGKRSDIEDVKEAIMAGMYCLADIRMQFPKQYAKYNRWIKEFINDVCPAPTVESHTLRPWQVDLSLILQGEPDKRKIIFIVDYNGDAGKSWFSEWYRQNHPKEVVKVRPGKKADMVSAAHSAGIQNPRVVFLDAPRSKQSRKKRDAHGNVIEESALMYDFLEEFKDGEIMVSKYESMIWRFPQPHVVVMTNSYPDTTPLSEMRGQIIDVQPARYARSPLPPSYLGATEINRAADSSVPLSRMQELMPLYNKAKKSRGS